MVNDIENWLRCNKCYRSMKKTGRIFSLTQCQHIFCNACVGEVEKQCPECKSSGVKTVSLVKPLPQPLLHYFGNVGKLVQQCLEASRFQRIQALIALRRFDDIQGKYEDMKRTYYEAKKHVRTVELAYKQMQEERAKIAEDTKFLRSMESQNVVKSSTENINFPREVTNHRVQQSQRSLGYAISVQPDQSPLPMWRNDISGPSSLNSSRSSITSSFAERDTRRHLQQQHVTPGASRNRPQIQTSGYRYSYDEPSAALEYPRRVVVSCALSPNDQQYQHTPAQGMGSIRMRKRIPGSLGDSSYTSSSGGTMRESPKVHDYYRNIRRS